MNPLPVIRIATIHTRSKEPAWLVEDLWGDQAVGFIGGTPKSGKTWLAIELAVAVATGRPCLGRYPVRGQGHVLLYAAEDTPEDIKYRTLAIAQARGVEDLERLAVGLIAATGLLLDEPKHRERLACTIDKHSPRLLILDPLTRIHHSDENSAADVGHILAFLRNLQRKYELAIVLVHHVRKSAATHPGQALRGSGDLHAWSDSNLYLLRSKGRLLLQAEHRAHPSTDPVYVELKTEPAPHLHILTNGKAKNQTLQDPLVQRVLDTLSQRPMTRIALRELLRVRNERLGQALTNLETQGRLRRDQGLLTVPVPNA